MKRLLFLAVAFIFFASLPTTVLGQTTLDPLIEGDESDQPYDSIPPQRIGVPAGEQMELTENGTGAVTGYCFDEYLIAPRRVTRFQRVLAGNNDAVVRFADGRSMTLKEAIAKKAVGVKAHQLRVSFTNLSGQPMSIDLRRPIVLWDRPAGAVSPQALDALGQGHVDYNTRQNMVWRITTAERLLSVLGYDKGSMWDYDANRQREAATAFQREKGIATTGTLDATTIQKLATTGAELQKRLRALGFRDRDGASLKEDLAAQIRAYERYLGSAPTGRWTPTLAQSFTAQEGIMTQLQGLRADGRTIAEVVGAGNPNVLTYLNGKELMLLVETPQGVELWNRRGTSMMYRDRGEKALTTMDDAAASLVRRASKNDRVVIYPRLGNDEHANIMVGNSIVQMDADALAGYVNGGAMPAELARQLNSIVPTASGADETGSRPTLQLVVYNGPLTQGRIGGALRTHGFETVDGVALAKALDRTYGSRASIYLSDDLRGGATLLNSDVNHGSLERSTSSERFAYADR